MNSKNYKFLSIKGTLLDDNQLKKYIEKEASNHNLSKRSSKLTYPIFRLNENYRFIQKTYSLLKTHAKIGVEIHPAGEWLLDNFYIIEESVKTITKELNISKYTKFPGLNNKEYLGYSRIYILSMEIVAYTDAKINDEILKMVLESYQKRKNLNMEEIWNLSIFLQIAVIEKIRNICEKIYNSQIQKYKVESIIERLVENKKNKDQKFLKLKTTYTTKDMKYPFIEYMSYKLKRYGKKGLPYLQVLEEEVNKNGVTISEIIKKEHFDIAISKVLIGNCILSIKEISRINFANLFENLNGVEETLKNDPADVYSKMDYQTKSYYRQKIKEISEKAKVSEIYVANKALKLAQSNNEGIPKKKHIGYYLIDKGNKNLYEQLKIKYKEFNSKTYIYSIYILSFIISILFGVYIKSTTKSIILATITVILGVIPISEIYIRCLNYVLLKIKKPKLIPKLDFSKGIPEEYASFVVIPTIIKDRKKVKELIEKLEVYYLANKSDNIYFALLGDCSNSQNENEAFDNEIIDEGIKQTQKLNEKYGRDIFYFLYRKRTWNTGEKSFLGWERKRGLISEFNNLLINKIDNFKANTIPKNFHKIKYIITLDSDTNLVLDSGVKLIGAMAHILNKPVLDKKKNLVVEGHGIIQPRIGIDLEASSKSIFAQIYSGLGGTDIYSNAISDIYQDNFNEGIFTGKGIYDLEIFNKVLCNEFPDNTILSHDLLEGCYLRCGLATDIFCMDGYPYKYNAYMQRNHRWVRGDWQIIYWLSNTIKTRNGMSKTNELNKLSKFKILDNLRRSLLPIISIILLSLNIVLNMTKIKTCLFAIVSIIALTISYILDFFNYVIFKKDIENNSVIAHRNIIPRITMLQSSFIKLFLEISFLPTIAYTNTNAIVKAIYRMFVSKENLLEWVTAEEAEKGAKTGILDYCKFMSSNLIFGSTFCILAVITKNIYYFILGLIWIVGPTIACNISKKIKNRKNNISEKDKDFFKEVAEKTWKYFNQFMNEENNFLPPDNLQEDRIEKIAHRTSPTNIGLGLLAIMSAYNLEFIKKEECIDRINKTMESIVKLQKWNGHLYNWYDTITLMPLYPRYVSTVDSGNFIRIFIHITTISKRNK